MTSSSLYVRVILRHTYITYFHTYMYTIHCLVCNLVYRCKSHILLLKTLPLKAGRWLANFKNLRADGFLCLHLKENKNETTTTAKEKKKISQADGRPD